MPDRETVYEGLDCAPRGCSKMWEHLGAMRTSAVDRISKPLVPLSSGSKELTTPGRRRRPDCGPERCTSPASSGAWPPSASRRSTPPPPPSWPPRRCCSFSNISYTSAVERMSKPRWRSSSEELPAVCSGKWRSPVSAMMRTHLAECSPPLADACGAHSAAPCSRGTHVQWSHSRLRAAGSHSCERPGQLPVASPVPGASSPQPFPLLECVARAGMAPHLLDTAGMQAGIQPASVH